MKRKEKITFAGITAVIFIIISLLIFTPSVFADSSERTISRYLSLFEQVFRYVHDNYVDEVDPEVLFEGALEGMFESLDDPHSTYLTETDMQDLTDTTSGKFGGVGLYISKSRAERDENGELPADYTPFVQVIAPIEDTPAAKADVHAGDLIIAIEGESTAELSIDEVVDRLRGTPGTEVDVEILRGRDLTLTITLTRAVIEVPTVKYDMINDDIAYIRIIQFTPLTASKTKEAVRSLKRRGFSSLIIDVRNNPGGLLSSVVDVANLFLNGGVIVSTRSRIDAENAVFTATPELELPATTPIIVLIDKGSASASEILAGALKDQNRATLLGETTFGKGSVQQVKYIGAGGFKLTMSRYYTPSGINIDKIGIEPDKELKEPELADEEWDSYQELLENNTVAEFVKENAPVTDREITGFIKDLREKGNRLGDRIIKRLIRNEINKTNDTPPVFDLEFDLVLQEAVRMLQSKEVR